MTRPQPIVFFVFKRPGSTRVFLDRIADSGTRKLYIYADAARNKTEQILTDQVREEISEFVSSHPQISVSVSYAKHNLGLRRSIVRGLNQTFIKESSAIILEDDCLPSPDFFRFASAMLDKYRDNPEVMSVTGTSVGRVGEYSYDFCRYQHCWGWGTWRRAWRLYDEHLSDFNPTVWERLAPTVWPSPLMRLYWHTMLTMTKAGWLDTWDFQWSYTHFVHHGLAIYPMVNLISNIGFDEAATNTKQASPLAGVVAGSLSWPLVSPPAICENIALTRLMEQKFYYNAIAFLGMMRQYIYWSWNKYAHRH